MLNCAVKLLLGVSAGVTASFRKQGMTFFQLTEKIKQNTTYHKYVMVDVVHVIFLYFTKCAYSLPAILFAIPMIPTMHLNKGNTIKSHISHMITYCIKPLFFMTT